MLELTWFWLVAVLVTLWAVLDGFDLGVGVLHRFVAHTDTERRQVLAAIGPVWDGNEVWLLAAGGSMFLAFPRLLAAGFSGFYLPVIFVVWALILRGTSIELRSHLTSPLWRSFFDTTFMVGSTAVPVLMGAALGNIVRGVPLNAEGFFELPLFGSLGVLEPYTVLIGVLVLVTLTAHGANWLAWKTDGAVQARVLRARMPLWIVAFGLWGLAAFATSQVAPEVMGALPSRPMGWLGLALVLGGAVLIIVKRRGELAPFFGGVAFIAGSLVTVVGCLFPVLLRGLSPEHSITLRNASAGGASMSAGLWWWGLGIALAAGYFWWVMRHFQGKAVAALDGEGY
jgi:cytochrome bd ubiquinol oxidase subunit II